MIDIAAAVSVINVISSAVGLADKIYNSFMKYADSGEIERSEPSQHSEKIEADKDNINLIHSLDGQPSKVITREDIQEKLDDMEVSLLEALELKMNIKTKQWINITKEYEFSTPAQKATYEEQLKILKREIGDLLKEIFKFLNRLGFQLQDHYGAMQHIAGS